MSLNTETKRVSLSAPSSRWDNSRIDSAHVMGVTLLAVLVGHDISPFFSSTPMSRVPMWSQTVWNTVIPITDENVEKKSKSLNQTYHVGVGHWCPGPIDWSEGVPCVPILHTVSVGLSKSSHRGTPVWRYGLTVVAILLLPLWCPSPREYQIQVRYWWFSSWRLFSYNVLPLLFSGTTNTTIRH